MATAVFTIDSVIRGYHVYKDLWNPHIGEVLQCKAEPGNIHDLYAVAVKLNPGDTTVGHVPRTISAVCCRFLRRGTITSEVIGPRQHSFDLIQGGLEVPCRLTFTGQDIDVGKVEKLLKCAPSVTCRTNLTVHETLSHLSSEPVSKRPKVDLTIVSNENENMDETWITIEFLNKHSFTLSVLDKVILCNGSYLNDKHITVAQELLRKQFPNTNGLHSTLYLNKIVASEEKITCGLQVIHDRTNHWILASNLCRNDNIVEVYDSIYKTVHPKTRTLLKTLFQPFPGKKPALQIVNEQKQIGNKDCGLFAIATATALLYGHDPASMYFSQNAMRSHLTKCFEEQVITPFPQEIL